jgi:hypothetical protein
LDWEAAFGTLGYLPRSCHVGIDEHTWIVALNEASEAVSVLSGLVFALLVISALVAWIYI